MNSYLRRISAVLCMAFGCAGVFGLLYYMNELTKPPAPEKAKVAKELVIEKQQKKKERPKPKPKAAPKKVAASSKKAATTATQSRKGAARKAKK